MRSALLACVLLPAFTSTSIAASWIINANGTGDFITIQSAVNNAVDGDEILLEDGLYSGRNNRSVDFRGKAITIRSQSGNREACTIDCERSGGIVFQSAETAASMLADVSVINAGQTHVGRAIPAVICGSGTAPTLRNLVIRDHRRVGVACYSSSSPLIENVTVRDGAPLAIHCWRAAPTIAGCVIEANTAVGSGGFGAISLRGQSNATIENCRITGNATNTRPLTRSGGIGVGDNSSAIIRNCVIAGNDGRLGGGILVSGLSSVTVEGCTIASNRANQGGGIYVDAGATVNVSRTILWGNCTNEGRNEAYLMGAMELSCSDVFLDGISGPGTLILQPDVILSDPLFCDPTDCATAPSTSGVYNLAMSSPALNANCGPMGALPGGCVVSVEPLSWGTIKALYR